MKGKLRPDFLVGLSTVHLFLLSLAFGDVEITLNSTWVRGDFVHFWRSTGFCPPDPHERADVYDLSADMVQNLAYIGAVPHRGIEQVRIHWLLSLVTVSDIENSNPVYNFSKLDALIDLLHLNGLKPGFELMGNPSDIYTDFEVRQQVYWWKDLVRQVAQRYINTYGLDYMKKWNFETWNEPDCKDFDKLKMTVQGFLNYYDACSEGLKAADPSLILGGPGDACGGLKLRTTARDGGISYADAFFGHVVNGTNYFTGEKGVRLDFISLHRKGGGKSIAIINEELEAMKVIANRYPTLAKKPFYNDEADPLVGWNKNETWRGGQIYAAMVVKIIAQHQNYFRGQPSSPINYALLSNDNGFLSYYPYQFTQRTLLARFQMNNTNPHYVTFVRKSVFGAMCMLSLLGDKTLHVDTGSGPMRNDSYVGAMATLHEPESNTSSDSWQMTFLIYESEDTQHGSKYDELLLNWYIIPPDTTDELMMAMYPMVDGGPYEVWAGLYNNTKYPTWDEFSYMRQTQEPRSASVYPVKAKPGFVPIPPMFQILEPDVVVMHLCAKPPRVPEEVTGLRFINITAGQVLVVWSDDNIKTKCILTYEVEYSPQGPKGPFTRVNQDDTIVTAFVFYPKPQGQGDKAVRGWYRIRAVDYWKRPGNYSETLSYTA